MLDDRGYERYRSSFVTIYNKNYGFLYTLHQLLINWLNSRVGNMHFIGHCHGREVKIRVNVWTVIGTKEGGFCREVAVS